MSALASNEKECLSGIIELEVSPLPREQARERKRMRGGGVLIRKTKRMFWVMIRKSTEEQERIFAVLIEVFFQLFLFD
jgi:hypothetical protein